MIFLRSLMISVPNLRSLRYSLISFFLLFCRFHMISFTTARYCPSPISIGISLLGRHAPEMLRVRDCRACACAMPISRRLRDFSHFRAPHFAVRFMFGAAFVVDFKRLPLRRSSRRRRSLGDAYTYRYRRRTVIAEAALSISYRTESASLRSLRARRASGRREF